MVYCPVTPHNLPLSAIESVMKNPLDSGVSCWIWHRSLFGLTICNIKNLSGKILETWPKTKMRSPIWCAPKLSKSTSACDVWENA